MKKWIVTFLLVIGTASYSDMVIMGGSFLGREVGRTKINYNSIEIYLDEINTEIPTGNIRKINSTLRIFHGRSGMTPYAVIKGNDAKFIIEGASKKTLFTIKKVNNEIRVYRGKSTFKQVMRLKRDGKYIKIYRNKGRGFPIARLKIEKGVYSDAEIIGILHHIKILS